VYQKYADIIALQQTTRPRMLKQRRDELVVMCVRMARLCAEARLTLHPEHFSLPGERPHQIIIRHLWALLDAGYSPGEVPYSAFCDVIAQELIGLRPEDLDQPWVGETINDPGQPGWEHEPPGLLWTAYNYDVSQFNDKYAFETLKLFLEERAVADATAGLVAAAGSRVPLQYADELKGIVAIAGRIEAIGTSPFLVPMPEDWEPEPLIYFPTGARWIDDRLGGQVAGDVNGLIGMFGGGKTTAMTQIAVGTRRYFFNEALKSGKKPKVALMVTYEEPGALIRPRVVSCAARISKTKLEEQTLADLTHTGKLDDYEIELYRDEAPDLDPGTLPGEYERFMATRDMVNQTVRIVEMREEGRGYGWVDELAAYIDRFRHEEDIEIGVVCIDYVNAMCRRYVDTLRNVRDKQYELRDRAQKTPFRVEELIARKFDCPVWLAQQFSGEANKKAPTAKIMLADASEARSFGENLVFCIGFGTTEPLTKVIQVTYVKSRRKGVQGSTSLVQLEGDLGRLVPADHRYEVQGDQIVDRRIKNQFQGPTESSPFLIGGNDLGPKGYKW
jgi:hypothetical protein